MRNPYYRHKMDTAIVHPGDHNGIPRMHNHLFEKLNSNGSWTDPAEIYAEITAHTQQPALKSLRDSLEHRFKIVEHI